MGSSFLCKCGKEEGNLGQIQVDVSLPGQPTSDSINIKNVKDLKRKSISIKFDKKDFIRMKTDPLFEEYDIKEKLGEGAYGCVYKVQHKVTNYLRAVKAIKRKHVDNSAFSNEIDVLKTVDHPHIIRLFDCYVDDSYFYMVEEYCSGGDLFDYIQKERCFTEKKACEIFTQLLSAVNHLHKKKIVHRDLKPENIVFIETKNSIFIKLIDFGTSVAIKGKKLTQELGTIYYIAPEVFMNSYNEKADIWSCGIILYTMLCGHPPFCGNREDVIKNKILHGKLQFPTKDFKHVSPEAVEFIKHLLTYEPEKRPTADEAFKDKWIVRHTKQTTDTCLVAKDIIKNIAKFSATISLQKATLSFLANQMSINEEIKILKDEFDKIDLDKDGEISKEELIKCMEALYPHQEAVIRAEQVFQEIDFNNDGTINFSEFLTMTISKEKLLSEDTLTKAFKLFDVDGNGQITIDELKETLPLDITEKQGWVALIKEVDDDGDYQISFKEFKEMMEKMLEDENMA